MSAYRFVGGIADGQMIETDGALEWRVPHPPRVRRQAIPDVERPDILTRLAIRNDARIIDRYVRQEWREYGKPAEHRYVFAERL
jgi:hypothetical protein